MAPADWPPGFAGWRLQNTMANFPTTVQDKPRLPAHCFVLARTCSSRLAYWSAVLVDVSCKSVSIIEILLDLLLLLLSISAMAYGSFELRSSSVPIKPPKWINEAKMVRANVPSRVGSRVV